MKAEDLEKDLKNTRDGTLGIVTRLEPADVNVKVLEVYLAKKKQDVTLLTTELAAATGTNAKLYRDLQFSWKDLTRAKADAQEASKSVFEIQGPVTNGTREMDEAFRNAITDERISFDHIHVPTGSAPSFAPGGVSNAGVADGSDPPENTAGGPATRVDAPTS